MQKSGGAVILMERKMIKNKITTLAGGWDFHEIMPQEPFNEETIAFLDDLSKEICQNERTKDQAQARAFAFWCRKNHISQWKKKTEEEKYALGLGMIFHIAPANIPYLFAYSMVFGMLSGNGNVIRISQRTWKMSQDLCKVIDEVMQRENYQNIYQNNWIMTYEKDDEITKELSKQCDGRVVWGGDGTIETMKQYPLKPTAMEITFPDRNSVAVFDLSFMKEANQKEKEDLAYRFYNDTLLMDQNACSSPRLIYWRNEENIGKIESEDIKKEWWNLFLKVSQKYDLSPWKVSEKYEQLCNEIMEFYEIFEITRYGGNQIYVAQIRDLPEKVDHYQAKFGCFYECEIKSLSQMCKILDRKVQTIVYEGIDPKELAKEIIRSKKKGADRIVRAGSALELDHIWDGKDIIGSLSRIIQVK